MPTLPRLLFITDRRRSQLPVVDAVSLALHALPPNSAMVLLREKDLSGRELAELARSLLQIMRRHNTRLLISTRADVAVAVGANGVHLGGDAADWEATRTRLPREMLVGVSLHEDDEPFVASSTSALPDYALLSPVFPTSSKPEAAPLELFGLASGCARFREVPVFALGGVDASNAPACLDSGAHGVAVLSAVLTAPDPNSRARELWSVVENHLGQEAHSDPLQQRATEPAR